MTVHELALDIVSIHARITLILANVLAFAEDFECESVGEQVRWKIMIQVSKRNIGDPQTAVGQYGDVILFVQSVLVKYRVSELSSVSLSMD